MGAHKHLPEAGKVAVVVVVDLNDTPRVLAAADLFAVVVELLGGADNGEGNAVLWVISNWVELKTAGPSGSEFPKTHNDGLGFRDGLRVVSLVDDGLVDLDLVELNVLEDLWEGVVGVQSYEPA